MSLLGFRYDQWYKTCVLKDEFNFYAKGSYATSKDSYDRLSQNVHSVCINLLRHFNDGKAPLFTEYYQKVIASYISSCNKNEVIFVIIHANGMNLIPASLGVDEYRNGFTIDTIRYRDELDILRRNVYHAIYIIEATRETEFGAILGTKVDIRHCELFKI